MDSALQNDLPPNFKPINVKINQVTRRAKIFPS